MVAVTPEEVRANARALRLRIEAGDKLTLEEARAVCVTMADALLVFERVEPRGDDGEMPVCCGGDVTVTAGIFGQMARCPRCGAEARDATSPMFSPFLERGNSHITLPSPEWCDAFGERTWIVMHEGDRS